MKVLLKRDVTKLGKAGVVKNVADGYGRNYLIPQGLATLATPGALKQAETLSRAEQKRQAALASEASSLAEQLAQISLSFKMRAGEAGKLYGSVTSQNIVDEVKRVAGLDDMVGSIAEIEAAPDAPHQAWAHLRGETWRVVCSTPLQPHQKVRVVGRRGLLLEVVPAAVDEQGG